jgi:AcrR family transcriptional regulator
MKEKETKRKQAAAKREQSILLAAMEVFSRKGFAAATMPEIARSAGVAVGTIYIYYPNKRELFIAVINSFLISPLLKIFQEESKREFSETLLDAIKDRLNLLDKVGFNRFLPLMSEIMRDPELGDMFTTKLVQPFMSKMESIYRRHIESGDIRGIDPALAVRAAGGTVIGLIMLRAMEGEASPLNRMPQEKAAAEIMAYITRGMGNGT